jgi:hypothetical protein
MSDAMQISAEDRERLAKSKFGEWFDEFFDKKFEEAFEKKATSSRSRAARTEHAEGNTSNASESHEEQPQRRRSLLEECLTNTFGF